MEEEGARGFPREEDGFDAGLWPGDSGTLDYESRRTLLQLVKGPYITADRDKDLWKALLNDRAAIESRLCDLFLELVVDESSGVAFVRNVAVEDFDAPLAVRAQALNIVDTAMVLMLRRELLNRGFERAVINKEEFLEQMKVYRPLSKEDEAGFAKTLNASWNKLDTAGILLKVGEEDRREISPVLRLVFDAEEARAVQQEFQDLLDDAKKAGDSEVEGGGSDEAVLDALLDSEEDEEL